MIALCLLIAGCNSLQEPSLSAQRLQPGTQWQNLGSWLGQNPKLVNNNGQVLTVWNDGNPMQNSLLAGNLGETAKNVQEGHAAQFSLAASGTPTAAFVLSNTDGSESLMVSRLQNGAWQNLGTALNQSAEARLSQTSVATNGADVVVAWVETLGTQHQIFAKRFHGNAWQALGTAFIGTSYVERPALAFYNNQPVLAFSDANGVQVQGFNGTAWQVLGKLGLGTASSLVGSKSNLFVAFSAGAVSAGDVVVKRFDGKNWKTLAALDTNPKNDATNPSLVLQNNLPVVAWQEDTSYSGGNGWNVFAKRFDGQNWQDLGSNISSSTNDARNPSLVVMNNELNLAWDEQDKMGRAPAQVLLARWK